FRCTLCAHQSHISPDRLFDTAFLPHYRPAHLAQISRPSTQPCPNIFEPVLFLLYIFPLSLLLALAAEAHPVCKLSHCLLAALCPALHSSLQPVPLSHRYILPCSRSARSYLPAHTGLLVAASVATDLHLLILS